MRTESELREALTEMAAHAPACDGRLSEAVGRSRQRSVRHRARVLVSVVVVAAVVAVASAVLVPGRVARRAAPAGPAATPASWSMTYRVDPPQGWRVSQEEVYRDAEQVILRPTGSSAAGTECSVVADRAGQDGPTVPGTETVLGGRTGVLVLDTAERRATFRWPDVTGARVEATCAGVADPRGPLAAMVGGVRAAPHALVVPFSMAALPSGLEVKTVYDSVSPVTGTQGVDLGDRSEARSMGSINVYLMDQDPLRPDWGNSGERVSVAGRSAVFVPATGGLCFPGRPTVCVSDSEPSTDPASGAPQADDELRAVFAVVQPAGDLGDRATWPTAADALPG